MNHQLSSTDCPIRKTFGYHRTGIVIGILLGIFGTILVQNFQPPAWMKADVPLATDPPSTKYAVPPVPQGNPNDPPRKTD